MRPNVRRALVAFAAVGLLLAGCGTDSDGDGATTTTTTPTDTAVSTSAPTAEQPETAVWPFASSATRFDDPVAAATSFAVDYLGFVDPVIGEFQGGDSRSGEVAIRPTDDGPVTTVFVRMVTSDESWWVLGAATANLQLESPEAVAAISSPVTLAGQSTAFEATVNVEIRQDDSMEPLAEDIVMGGSMGDMGPFSKEVTFATPQAEAGAIILKTYSAEDGTILEAGVLRVGFAG
jgi:hypothetical protein